MKNIYKVMPTIIVAILFSHTIVAADYQPGKKTNFVLIKPLIIPQGAASVYIQGSKATRDVSQIDQYEPSCLFEQRDLMKVDTPVKPQTFNVTDTRLSRDFPTQGVLKYETLFYLLGESDKKKYTLECAYWVDSSDHYLTRTQIQETIKEYFKINP